MNVNRTARVKPQSAFSIFEEKDLGNKHSHSKNMAKARSFKAPTSTIGPDLLGGRRVFIRAIGTSRVASMMNAITRTAQPKPIFLISSRRTIG